MGHELDQDHGNHQFKFGADFRYARNLRVPSDANRTGEYTFSTARPPTPELGGLDLATFLLGDVTQVSRYVSTSLNAAERQHTNVLLRPGHFPRDSKTNRQLRLALGSLFPEYVNGKDKGGFANILFKAWIVSRVKAASD